MGSPYSLNTPTVSRNTDEFTFLLVTGLSLVKISNLDYVIQNVLRSGRLCVFVASDAQGIGSIRTAVMKFQVAVHNSFDEVIFNGTLTRVETRRT
jgi:hypothetical protein